MRALPCNCEDFGFPTIFVLLPRITLNTDASIHTGEQRQLSVPPRRTFCPTKAHRITDKYKNCYTKNILLHSIISYNNYIGVC